QLENTNLKLGNEYLKTDQYIELSARQKFGKAAPGETVYIVPKNVAIANTVEIKKKQEAKEVKEEQKPSYQKNLESWMDFFFGNKSNN
ncbi:hypothetical protein KDA11_06615, partial [Candidatus Saccharibacteria bacterium]|nr:hypothetical protein [Candidatus Saccharibacteria bacterium]